MHGLRSAGPILVAEDDPHIAHLLERYLARDGFATRLAGDGREALELCARHEPVLVVLDLMLPRLNGWEVCRALREKGDTPVLMLTARETEADRIRGFALGADDYVVKPFSPREVVERIKAILRRTLARGDDLGEVLSCGALDLEPETYRVSVDGRAVDLTACEFRLLETLMRRPGRVFTRDELLERLHGAGGAVVDRVIDVHIGKIRQKIEPDPAHPRFVLTRRGVGYQMVAASRA